MLLLLACKLLGGRLVFRVGFGVDCSLWCSFELGVGFGLFVAFCGLFVLFVLGFWVLVGLCLLVGGFVVSCGGFTVCFRFRALFGWWFMVVFGCDCFRLCWLCGVFKFHIVYMGFRISFRFVFYWFAFRVYRDIACGLYGLFWLMALVWLWRFWF